MVRWYAVNTYSGHEKKAKADLERRITSLSAVRLFRRVVIPTESVVEMKAGQKIQLEKRTMPGYVLVNMDLNDDSWTVVKGTPGIVGFVGSAAHPIPLSPAEVARLLHVGGADSRRSRASYEVGDRVRIASGALTDFEAVVVEVNESQQRLRVETSIFERQTTVELAFAEVRKED